MRTAIVVVMMLGAAGCGAEPTAPVNTPECVEAIGACRCYPASGMMECLLSNDPDCRMVTCWPEGGYSDAEAMWCFVTPGTDDGDAYAACWR